MTIGGAYAATSALLSMMVSSRAFFSSLKKQIIGLSLLMVAGSQTLPHQAPDFLSDRRVDGIIVVGGQIAAERLRRIADEIPLIVVAREVKRLRATASTWITSPLPTK